LRGGFYTEETGRNRQEDCLAVSTPEEREEKVQEAIRELDWERQGRRTVLVLLAVIAAGVLIWWIFGDDL
jgi:hypothetical protein